MLNKIIRFSLQNRLFVLVVAVLLVIGGLYTAKNAEIDVFPDLNAPTVVVMTEAGGMAAEEVEQLVTFPIETSVNGATGVRRVRSSSTAGFSVVWVEFEWDTDIYLARQIVSEKLATVSDALPDNVGSPTLGPQSSILGELLIIGLTADSTSMQDLRTMADWTIRPRLLSTGGVAQVSVIGGDLKEYQILLSPDKMKHYGVSLAEVTAVTRGMNRSTSGGVIYEYGNEYILRGVVSPDAIGRISKSVVKVVGGSPITLTDIAEIKVGAESPKLGVASEKGRPAILLTVTKQPYTGTVELTEKLEYAIADLQKSLPADVHISTDIFRQSRFIESSIDNVKTSLFEGALFVVIILFLFLANIRTTVISLVTIPLSLIVSLLVLHYLGMSINTMSLGGMAIAIGSLVDDAIVDVENVWKKLRENNTLPETERRAVLSVVYDASREVRMPILNSTLIIIVSFMPLFFLTDMEGRMLIPLGIAFIVSLFASTAVALTLTPVLCSYMLNSKATDKAYGKEAFVTVWLKKYYHISLLWVLKHKKTVVSSTIVLFVVTSGIFLTLGSSFLPPFNEGSFTINISSLPGISLEESDKIGRKAEEILLAIPEIKTVARKTGRAELDEHALGVNVSEIEAPFELDRRTHRELLNDIRDRLSVIAGVNIEIGQPISHRIDAMLSGTQANIAIKLFGDDLNEMFTLGNRIKDAIQSVEGIADLNVEQQIERPELKIMPKPEMLSRYGISEPEFNEFVTVMMAGETVSQVYEGNKKFNLVVKADDSSRNSIENIRRMLIDTPDGQKIPLTYVADVVSAAGPNAISRENVKRKIVISANTDGRDLSSVVNDIQAEIDGNIVLPEGYHIEYGGQFENAKASGRILLLASLISVVVIYLLLYMQFRSAFESSVILLNLPFALIGGVLVLWGTTGEVSIPAIIGFISLFGIATRNGMLLITRYNHLRHTEGLSIYESIIKGSLDRLNPILMTALTSALALFPLALRGDLPGNEIQSPMATVILGGLLTSTFLNVFIIPIVYGWIHRKDNNK
ncbi:efflux RND transporter permease subunit [Xylanibacter rodentium]|jgi:CzcA family heavy metal efflux pump|uniref:Efflux RND transporter permease subunit n=1 Tax=Xylanibacter rodentium TaxID=2736289 RepID=A0ABX2AUM9_9BACT|nr:efflux RND transporter permease subunit [Xylanibacter rodentium]NPE11368.1 efflux RND transporter permease subunit [Prevotella sp. PJ1A]NPE14070.1 efflux RND transporter permease subunit [Xylanibacter rodentium]NPE39814.1 efflux RND transporter permease subunit [Prevotella sp. PCJ2]